jgi:putative transposase
MGVTRWGSGLALSRSSLYGGSMARPLRIEYPGAVYHITSRGNARMVIFEDNYDRTVFLHILEEVIKRYNWICHAYCLMDNHYHFLLETVDPTLSIGMRYLNGVYTQRYNRRHHRVGHIFQGRFKSILVDRDSYLLELCRYVVLNPVRAGSTKRASLYRWSSYKPTAGLSKPPSFLTVDWILPQFGKNRKQAQQEYRQFILAGMEAASPWEELKAQCILGGKEFFEKIRSGLDEKSDITEIPREQRQLLRPPLIELFPENPKRTKEDRNRAIRKAHMEHGYQLNDIAGHLGLHYATVGRIIKSTIS